MEFRTEDRSKRPLIRKAPFSTLRRGRAPKHLRFPSAHWRKLPWRRRGLPPAGRSSSSSLRFPCTTGLPWPFRTASSSSSWRCRTGRRWRRLRWSPPGRHPTSRRSSCSCCRGERPWWCRRNRSRKPCTRWFPGWTRRIPGRDRGRRRAWRWSWCSGRGRWTREPCRFQRRHRDGYGRSRGGRRSTSWLLRRHLRRQGFRGSSVRTGSSCRLRPRTFACRCPWKQSWGPGLGSIC